MESTDPLSQDHPIIAILLEINVDGSLNELIKKIYYDDGLRKSRRRIDPLSETFDEYVRGIEANEFKASSESISAAVEYCMRQVSIPDEKLSEEDTVTFPGSIERTSVLVRVIGQMTHLDKGGQAEIMTFRDEKDHPDVVLKIYNDENDLDSIFKPPKSGLFLSYDKLFRNGGRGYAVIGKCRGDLLKLAHNLTVLDYLVILNELNIHKIAHRDIKPKNILVTRSNKVVLADFDMGSIDGLNTKKYGTIPYMPKKYVCQHHSIDLYGLTKTLAQSLMNNYKEMNDQVLLRSLPDVLKLGLSQDESERERLYRWIVGLRYGAFPGSVHSIDKFGLRVKLNRIIHKDSPDD
jgi:serine/threonine protein kinase